MGDGTSGKVHRCNDSKGKFLGYMIHCPACKCGHLFDSRWTFNGDFKKPTFRASMLVHGNEKTRAKTNGRYGHRCHSFVTDGKIKFLSDCTHDMKDTEVALEDF